MRLPHLVYISVVGAERIPIDSRVDRAMFGYFASKRAAEKVVEDSGLPWTTLRATQFHEGMLTVARQMQSCRYTGPGRVLFPTGRGRRGGGQARRAHTRRAGRLVPDMGGPRVYGADELLRGYLRATQRRRLIVPVWLPGKAASAFRAGANLAPSRPWDTGLGRSSSPRI